MNDCVVITGAGAVCSLGHTASEIWDSILTGKSGICSIEGFDARGFDCQVAAQVDDLNPSEMGIHSRDARIMDKHSYMLMKCAQDAFIQSSLDKSSIPKEDIGFFAGMGMVDYEVQSLLPAVLESMRPEGNIDYDAFYSNGYKEIYPLWPLSMLNNISFCQVCINLDIKGENSVFSPAADSGAQAIVEGLNAVLNKKTRVVLAGGVSEKVSPSSLARAYLNDSSNVEDTKETAGRSFNENRKEAILGEGCGILAMELRSSADERGIPYSTKATGYGFAFEIKDGTSGPTVNAISRSMKDALGRAKINPSSIDLVIANDDRACNGDKREAEAIHKVFDGHVKTFSSKGALGNLLAGAPAVDIILGINMIESGTIPVTLNSSPPGKNVMPDIISKDLLHAHPKRILVNCQSHEGQSASLIIESVN